MHTVTLNDLINAFPFTEPRSIQSEALSFIAQHNFNALCEIPTGEGKTAIGMAILRAFSKAGIGPIFYIVPSKTLVEQVRSQFPNDVTVVLGRSEYECLYYTDRGENIDAAKSPCYMLKCGHRVDMQTGETQEPGATPCAYYTAKYNAAQRAMGGGIIVTTMAFFLMNRFVVPQWREMEPALVVVDECHDLAKVTRGLFEYRLTYEHLTIVGEILTQVSPKHADAVYRLAHTIRNITHNRHANASSLLKDEEIEQVVTALADIDVRSVEGDLREAIENTSLDPVKDRWDIKVVEGIVNGVPKFLRSLKFALEDEAYALPNGKVGRPALNYVVAFRAEEENEEVSVSQRAKTWVGIRSYFVAGLLKKALGHRVVAYSATIGDASIFGHESGLRMPFRSFSSSFDATNTRIFLPNDAPNLSMSKAQKNDRKNAFKMIATSAARFAEVGHRSLVVVISETDRIDMLRWLKRADLDVMTYNDCFKAKRAAQCFKEGEGQVLLGTAAQYAQGIDLPAGIAPVIFFLRPGYQRPDDPMTQFEQRRFPDSHCWKLWKYRVMLEALQVRGRNVRSMNDLGVCFFISKQFRSIVYHSLPETLRSSYREQLAMDACVEEALALLS